MQTLQERLLLGVGERRERALERERPTREPVAHGRLRRGRERDDGTAAVGGILAADEEAVLLELARERRGGREREPEVARQLTHRLLALAAHLGEERDVPPAEGRARHELEQLRGRPSAAPEAAHHAP